MPKKPTAPDLFKEAEEPQVKYKSREPISITGKASDKKKSEEWTIRTPDEPIHNVPPITETALSRPIIETMHHFTGKVAAPKLYIKGRSTLDGRLATTLRIRPSLVEDLEKVAVGPLYLLVDVAIQRLIAELMDMPKDAPSIAIAAESMDPGVYDRAMLQEADRVPKKRVEFLHAQQARQAAEAKAASDESAAIEGSLGAKE